MDLVNVYNLLPSEVLCTEKVSGFPKIWQAIVKEQARAGATCSCPVCPATPAAAVSSAALCAAAAATARGRRSSPALGGAATRTTPTSSAAPRTNLAVEAGVGGCKSTPTTPKGDIGAQVCA